MPFGVIAGIAIGAGVVLAGQAYYAYRQPPSALVIRSFSSGQLDHTITYSSQDTYSTLQQKIIAAVPGKKATDVKYAWNGRGIDVPIDAPLTENQYPFFKARVQARQVYYITSN